MLATLLSTFGVVFIAELPDKTAIASLVLATRYRARSVITGAWLAFLVQTVIAVAAGGLLHLLPARPVHIAAGLGFLVFAVLAWRRNEEAEVLTEEQEVTQVGRRNVPAWVSSFLVVFAAEWGDLTQLATAALAARSSHPFLIGIGAVLALWSVTVLAVAVGSQAGRLLSSEMLTRASAALFALVGVFVLATGIFK